MKIAIINSLYYPYKFGGAEVSVQLLAEGFAAQGHSVKVITLNDNGQINRYELNGVSVISYPIKNEYWPFAKKKYSSIKKLKWHLKDYITNPIVHDISAELEIYKPDIIHTNNLAGFSIGIWGIARKLCCPLVHTTRDYYLFHPNSTLFKNGRNMSSDDVFVKFYSWAKKKASQKIDVMVGISCYISQLHKLNGFAEKAKHTYVYNPIEKIPLEKCKHDRVTIGFLGRLTSEKGFDVFVEYANKYKAEMNFVAAGQFSSSNESDKLRTKAIENNVKLQGYVPVKDFLSSVDVLLLPTKWNEPFGRAVAEAAVAGVPVYTNLTGGVKEIGEHFSWVQDITEFNLSNIKKILSCVDTKLIENPFRQDVLSQKYLEIYNEAIYKEKQSKLLMEIKCGK
ncbi:glycosyltransferase [Klebsiella quasipneumoniae]|uniref:glycosyltransferase n=1 Tax=Klebsiella quasipneumoniae TaxID=1463165 RepID=UPI00128C05A7|nr:glycosyltransferase [Klebsiella quasipneumoniae]HBY4118693.1 glycosyltransferase [Klebsiella pneumoniae]